MRVHTINWIGWVNVCDDASRSGCASINNEITMKLSLNKRSIDAVIKMHVQNEQVHRNISSNQVLLLWFCLLFGFGRHWSLYYHVLWHSFVVRWESTARMNHIELYWVILFCRSGWREWCSLKEGQKWRSPRSIRQMNDHRNSISFGGKHHKLSKCRINLT